MRLFTAIDLPLEAIVNLETLLARLKPLARIKWTPAANFHVTTKFIGEWPEARLDEVKAALGALPGREPIPIAVRGLGFFPNARAPRAFWAGVEASAALTSLARETDEAVARLGAAPETRPYSPHLTLARFRKEPVPLDAFHAAIANLTPLEFGTATADRFFLYLSRAAEGASVYTKLSEFKFR